MKNWLLFGYKLKADREEYKQQKRSFLTEASGAKTNNQCHSVSDLSIIYVMLKSFQQLIIISKVFDDFQYLFNILS